MDSSRYFVLQIASGAQHAFIGMGFAERGDSFDLQAAVQDHFRYIKVNTPSIMGETITVLEFGVDVA